MHNFGDAMGLIAKGYQVRRLEWEDENVRVALVMEKIMIFLSEDNKFHPFIINTGDLYGNDWVVASNVKGICPISSLN